MNNDGYLLIKKRGDDQTETISVRMPRTTLEQIDQIAKTSGQSRNKIINQLISFNIDKVKFVE